MDPCGPARPVMPDRLPASLAYILIYNPTLPPPAYTSKDDEDAQEEAHILFYTSRERAVSRDRMLRQVGLAKALVNFSDIFAPGQGCDNVHSQTKRMSHVSPEPDFWMHACVDLARTQKPTKDDAKITKAKDHPQAYYHHEDSLHDLALRDHLLRGYEAFKLLHGTFTSVLETRGAESLRAQLEHFFTPWAWKWDIEIPINFSTHLGQPLLPLDPTIAPIVNSFLKDLPPNATPLLVSPPYIIDLAGSTPQYPPSLPAYLLSLVPPPGPPVSRRSSNKRHDSSTNVRTIVNGSTNTTLGFLSAAGAGMGDAMNVKKWSWPEALMFGRQKPPSNRMDIKSFAETETVSEPDDPGLAKTTIRGQSPHISTTHVEGAVDQFALDDAISNQNSAPAPALVHTVDGHDKETDVGSPESVLSIPSVTERQNLSNVQSDPPTIMVPSMPTPPEGRTFSVIKVFVSESSDPLIVRRRSVIYMSMFQMVFAILMDVDWLENVSDESLLGLQQNTPGFLEHFRQAIDSRNSSDSSTNAEKNTASNHARHVILSSHKTVSVSEGVSTTSSQFFEGQEMLAQDSSIIEVFSRTGSPPHWFVARRGLGFDNAGEKLQGEAYLEASNKDASLVDADNELVGAVRRWVHRSK